jgi:4-amino-4-deoxy-L-arabinose transferase-like glycosyltransferase
MFTLLTALSVFLLLRANRTASLAHWVAAGLTLGAAVLTRQTLAPFAAAALIWLAIWGEQPRLRRFLTVGLAFGLAVVPWLVRNYFVVGAPVLTSEFGRQLWNANNAKTFSHYPSESIDRSADEAFSALTPADQRELDGLSGNEIGESDWFLRKGIDYIEAHPDATLVAAVRKVAAGFSWRFNPVREPLVQAAYLASYGPISILGVLGMLMTRSHWREHMPIYLLFLAFVAVTAIFWAHTSHRSYLDVYWIVFASYTLARLFGRGAGSNVRAYLVDTTAQRSTLSAS